MTCTITRGKSATRTIGTALGFSKKGVASELNISHSSTVSTTTTTTTGCSKWIKNGQKSGTDTTVSGWRYTYNPYKNGIHCEVIR